MLKKYTLLEKHNYIFTGKLQGANKQLVSFLKNKMFFVFFNNYRTKAVITCLVHEEDYQFSINDYL